jgi:hypothetical protein
VALAHGLLLPAFRTAAGSKPAWPSHVFLGSQPTVLTDASWVAVVHCPPAPGPLDQGWLAYWLLGVWDRGRKGHGVVVLGSCGLWVGDGGCSLHMHSVSHPLTHHSRQ